MGGEKFDTPHPEGYLFGENMDLNFLGNRPVQFPYVTPAPHEPVKTLRSLVNIRKDSLRLVRYKDDADSPTEENEKPRVLYSLEFTFDADTRVAITIYCQATEEFLNGMAVYSPKSTALQSETIHYKRGVGQQFSLPSFKIDFSEWKDDELNFDLDRGMFPVVVQAVVDEGDVVEVTGHAHVLLAAFEKHMDGSFSVKPLKQKQIVDRVSYLLQEIYGIENKNNQDTKPSDDENSDNSNECVVCLSDLRDTLILPCRHLCLCNSCADTLRYQANNCPICRLPFRALLQIRAVRKKPGALSPVSFSPVLAQSVDHDEHSCPFKKSKSHPASLASKKPKRETSQRPRPGREFCGTSKAHSSGMNVSGGTNVAAVFANDAYHACCVRSRTLPRTLVFLCFPCVSGCRVRGPGSLEPPRDLTATHPTGPGRPGFNPCPLSTWREGESACIYIFSIFGGVRGSRVIIHL
nr:E3 ubiquitin-protein ligase MGRN1 isoform X7 [Loxodonta africana]